MDRAISSKTKNTLNPFDPPNEAQSSNTMNRELWKKKKEKYWTHSDIFSLLSPTFPSQPTLSRADNNNVSNWLFRERRGSVRK